MHWNTSWLNPNSSFELRHTFLGNQMIINNFKLRLLLLPFAHIILANIGIIRCKFQAKVLCIIKSPSLQSPPTPSIPISSGAVIQILFWQFHQGPSFYKMSSFHCGYWWKCPAGSTLTLILDWIYCAFCSPIYGFCKVLGLQGGSFFCLLLA